MSPIVNNEMKNLKDTFWRAPINYLKERPKYMKTGDKLRQK
jgi:spore germination protein